ncbi:MAG: sugar phosphate isomerase/epimerase [Planctomycetes bacterium]|nr:sugar phosphate isomerase/epimerase [Planctomycetota bacterium]
MKTTQIAAQLFTLRDHCKTAADLATTLKKVRAIGYRAAQVSGVGPIPPEEIKRIADGEGIVICATHEGGGSICDTPQAVVDRLGKLGTKDTAYPFPHVPIATLDDVKRLAGQLDRAGDVLRRAGMRLSYHNHAHEFRKVEGKTVLQWLYDLTDSRNLLGEPDTYWVQTGGGDPVEWVQRLHGRLPILHLKDYKVGDDNKPIMCEVGNGNLNWPAIIRSAEISGCPWFIVEQDVCPADPFDSLKQSWNYLTTFIAER